VGALLDREQHRLDALRSRPVLARPWTMLDSRAGDIAALRERATRCLAHRLDRGADELLHTVARLRALSPAATLERGYAIVQRADGAVVRRPDEVAAGDPLRVRLAGGELAATVAEQ
jgi:exodeoxyribonuclease VII large subunit